jgi:hypothetical protein
MFSLSSSDGEIAGVRIRPDDLGPRKVNTHDHFSFPLQSLFLESAHA